MLDSTLNGVPFKVVFPHKKSKFQFVFGDFYNETSTWNEEILG
jgi:hypothetical protein